MHRSFVTWKWHTWHCSAVSMIKEIQTYFNAIKSKSRVSYNPFSPLLRFSPICIDCKIFLKPRINLKYLPKLRYSVVLKLSFYLACKCSLTSYNPYLFITARCNIVIDDGSRLDTVDKVKNRRAGGDSRVLQGKETVHVLYPQSCTSLFLPSQTIAMSRYTQLYVKLLHIYRSHITGTVKHAWLSLSLSLSHSLTRSLSLFLSLSLQ